MTAMLDLIQDYLDLRGIAVRPQGLSFFSRPQPRKVTLCGSY